jgi:hypothetical protein
MLIGLIGLTSDMVLAWIGRALFPWQPEARRSGLRTLVRALLTSRRREHEAVQPA